MNRHTPNIVLIFSVKQNAGMRSISLTDIFAFKKMKIKKHLCRLYIFCEQEKLEDCHAQLASLSDEGKC